MAWSSHTRICIITSIKCLQTNQTKPNATRAFKCLNQSFENPKKDPIGFDGS